MEELQYSRCRRSLMSSYLTHTAIFSVILSSAMARFTPSPRLHLAAFALPAVWGTWASSRYSRVQCATTLAFSPNSPLGHDVRQVLRHKWGHQPWMRGRLDPLTDIDHSSPGTGLPLLYDLPTHGSTPPSSLPTMESADEDQPEDDLPHHSDPSPEDGLEEEAEEADTHQARPIKRPFVAVNVNDRTLISFPPGRTSAPPKPIPSTPSPSPLSPVGRPLSSSQAPPPPISRSRPVGGPGVRRSADEGEDEFGLGEEEAAVQVKRPGRGDEEDRRRRREERRREEMETRSSGGRGGGERRRVVRRNEFGDEIEEDQ
jgi:hypothetical protein